MPIRSQKKNLKLVLWHNYDCNEPLPVHLLCLQRTFLNFSPLPVTFIADVKLDPSADLYSESFCFNKKQRSFSNW